MFECTIFRLLSSQAKEDANNFFFPLSSLKGWIDGEVPLNEVELPLSVSLLHVKTK